MISHIQLTQSA